MKQMSPAEREAFRQAREAAIDDLFRDLGLQRLQRRSSTGFPFDLPEQGVQTALTMLERLVTRAVESVLKRLAKR